ncbi:MAG: YiiX/YebB-like N1pC/P60 family cysteine hydrolase [Thermodesulfobacteriota bacterium]
MAISVKSFPKEQPVNYDAFRSQIQTGDILLCSGSGWFSKMIQGSTESVWSHVGFVMRLDSIDRVMVLESVEPLGVRTVPLSKYLTDYDSDRHPYPGGLILARHQEFQAKAKAKALTRFGQFAVDLFGYPYDKDEIAKIAARIMASKIPFSAKDKKALAPDREFICSEYAYECYKSIGIEIDYDPRGFVAPADFARTPEVSLVAVLQGKK